jgi:cytochrome c oxidase accessory protein FixG
MNESATQSQPLYAARTHIYPRSVSGRYRRLKWAVVILAYSVYFLLPWLRWEREVGAKQAVLFDLAGRKFYLFDLVVHPQDIFWLAGLLMIAAYLLFFVTGLAGRVFCGYFCFQTLWTDVFILIERLVQGERPARIRLAKAPWGAAKLFKLGLTHLLWLLMGFITGLTFVLYWGDAPQLATQFFAGDAPFAAYATTLFLTATTYVMAGVAREQVCTYMCPYARFQAVMFDKDTLIVSYDKARGEGGRGRAKLGGALKTAEQRRAAGIGDCIDCGYCVQVCPTGIDIRNGLQIQCISCALCIDACDTIMDSLGWQRGLVGYSSQRVEEDGERVRVLRPKVVAYAAVLILAVGLLGWSVSHQAPFDLSVAQVRQPIYTQLSDGRIQNSYEIKVNNKTDHTLDLTFSTRGLPEGAELDLGRFQRVELQPEQRLRLAAKLRLLPTEFDGHSHPFELIAVPADASGLAPVGHPSVFYVPPR